MLGRGRHGRRPARRGRSELVCTVLPDVCGTDEVKVERPVVLGVGTSADAGSRVPCGLAESLRHGNEGPRLAEVWQECGSVRVACADG